MRLSLLSVALAAIAAGASYAIADGYLARLSNHRGYQLVAVADEPAAPPPPRPRHAVVIVADGLRLDAARGLASVARLRAAGQCRATQVGSLTISRPVYALLSTGVEADRSGARNNDETSPLAAESLWQVARAAGLRVTATSELPWFRQLFPDGFDAYAEPPRAADYFALAELADLTLIHPVYVDEAGHDHGGASRAYREAAARLDAELGRFLDARVDLGRDLVVFTADHGHSDRGGHGGASDDVSRVLTCFAGPGVIRASDDPPLDARAVAPTLAALLGLRFPRHMRAGASGGDDLDAVFSIADLPPAWAADRRAAIERFRQANPRWHSRYAGARAWQIVFGVLALLPLALALLSKRPRALPWLLAVVAATCAAHALVRGSLDFTAINRRSEWIRAALATCAAVGLLGAAAHYAIWRDRRRLLVDELTLVLAVFAASLAHPIAFGWTVGFPLPGPTLLFAPFLAAAIVLAHAALVGMLAAWIAWRGAGSSTT